MKYSQVKEHIIIPTLKSMSIPVSEEAIELLLMTMAHESLGGKYIVQLNGPALGVFQMEPATHNDIWENFLKYHHQLSFDALSFTISDTSSEDGEEMIGNMYYACAMARLHYYRVKAAIPARKDYIREQLWHRALAEYAKEHYNTIEGKATWSDYDRDYNHWKAGIL